MRNPMRARRTLASKSRVGPTPYTAANRGGIRKVADLLFRMTSLVLRFFCFESVVRHPQRLEVLQYQGHVRQGRHASVTKAQAAA